MLKSVHQSASEDETLRIANDLAGRLRPGDAVLLYGELGSGKSVFVRGIVRFFDSSIDVLSPSFTLINSYPTNPPIYHLDLYRLSGGDDLLDLGIEELLDGDGIVIVEWAEKCEQFIPRHSFHVRLLITGENGRRIQIDEKQLALRS